MGLSASQARLLSVTQRINNNELKSEILANNKIRLAEDGSRASEKYVNALNAKKLDYKVYKQSGDMETVALTFNALTNYSDLKTQYALMSANGQVYAASDDAKNYENANNLYEFLNSYGLIEENDDGGYTLLDDKKAQWYTNLWYKMDAQDDVDIRFNNFGDDDQRTYQDFKTIEKQAGSGNYLLLDDVFVGSSNWLQFALENGLAVLTRIQTDTSKEGKLFWQDIEYTSATDIIESDDDSGLQRAEMEYQQESKRIKAEDQKLDLDIKKLDTEHSSLKSEYDSIKNVLGKNVERSFSAFS
ncbi:MAG: hypothetical protein NC390_03800 [Fusobacterium sp.]|nr:hypothetical protein [Fusobacterium sp.]